MKQLIIFLLIFFVVATILDRIYYYYFIHNSEPIHIALNVQSTKSQEIKIYYSTESSPVFDEQKLVKSFYTSSNLFESVDFELPVNSLKSFRIDFANGANVVIKSIAISKGKFMIDWNYKLIYAYFIENESLIKHLDKDRLNLEVVGIYPYISLRQNKQNLLPSMYLLGNNKLILLFPVLLLSILVYTFLQIFYPLLKVEKH